MLRSLEGHTLPLGVLSGPVVKGLLLYSMSRAVFPKLQKFERSYSPMTESLGPLDRPQ
ncbi:hypothetical protein B0O99DRAFT_617266 [Bisporella sp. PMI_857]|nr:hypothetical protein B0O99DRAFT_617266 [Bisporella sp. PMI_857]